MREGLKDIYRAFGGKLIGSKSMKTHVCEVVSKLPDDIIEFITENCWFMGSMEDAWAFTFTGNDLKDNHLIFLSDELMMQDKNQIHHSIAHEIGHVILNHRNPVLIHQTKDEVQRQEKEADEFVRKYFE